MVRVPVLDENIDFVRLDLSRHYNVIDCDFSCYLVLNPNNIPPSMGTDIAVINIGSWQIDTWSFLTKKMFPNTPAFSACLVWDKTLVQDSEQGRKAPRVTESDVDIANSVSSLKGQPVNITGFSLDEGKSLKVSTLEDEFCNIRSFETFKDDKFNLFPSGGALYRFAVGGSFDLDKVKSFVSVEEIEGGYKFTPLKLTGVEGGLQTSQQVSISDLRFGFLRYVASANQYNAFLGYASDYYLNVMISEENVINSLFIHVQGMAHNVSSINTYWGASMVVDLPVTSVLVGF